MNAYWLNHHIVENLVETNLVHTNLSCCIKSPNFFVSKWIEISRAHRAPFRKLDNVDDFHFLPSM
jgi:hypothetical protein